MKKFFTFILLAIPVSILFNSCITLSRAALEGNVAFIKSYKGDINQRFVNVYGINGVTALMLAAQEGHTEAVKALIAAGAYVNAVDEIGRTALMFAANGEVVKALIAAGADVNAKSSAGKTALMWADDANNEEVVKALTEVGADVSALVDIAIKNKNYDEVIQLYTKTGENDKKIYKKVADIALKNEDYDKAIQLYTKTGEDDKEIYKKVADIAFNNRDYAYSYMCYEKLGDEEKLKMFEQPPILSGVYLDLSEMHTDFNMNGLPLNTSSSGKQLIRYYGDYHDITSLDIVFHFNNKGGMGEEIFNLEFNSGISKEVNKTFKTHIFGNHLFIRIIPDHPIIIDKDNYINGLEDFISWNVSLTSSSGLKIYYHLSLPNTFTISEWFTNRFTND